jgi:hypothetical protein
MGGKVEQNGNGVESLEPPRGVWELRGVFLKRGTFFTDGPGGMTAPAGGRVEDMNGAKNYGRKDIVAGTNAGITPFCSRNI